MIVDDVVVMEVRSLVVGSYRVADSRVGANHCSVGKGTDSALALADMRSCSPGGWRPDNKVQVG